MDALTLLAAVLLFSLLGTLIGAAAGMLPGLHINNVAYLLGASAGNLSGLALSLLAGGGAGAGEAQLLVAAAIVSCLVACTFTSILPSVFLGAPDPGRALSVLPAHRLLLAGQGNEAVRCSLLGCVGGLAACLLALPLFRIIMGDPVFAYGKLRPFMPLILALIVALLIVSEPQSPARRGRAAFPNRGKCVLILERVRMAAMVLSEPAEGPGARGQGPGTTTDGCHLFAPEPRAPGPWPLSIRPWQAPLHVGKKVCISGVVSETRKHGGRLSFVLEEGAALDVLVPPEKAGEAGAIRVGEIVVAEGRLAPAVGWGRGLRRIPLAAGLFLASGFLGLLVLQSGRALSQNWYPLGAPPVPEAALMFPLFCGLFGLPTLLLGLFEAPVAPRQSEEAPPMPARRKLRGILTGTVAGGILGWYPGMTSGHGSVLASLLSGEEEGDRAAPDACGAQDPGPEDLGTTGPGSSSPGKSSRGSLFYGHGPRSSHPVPSLREQNATREFLISVSAVAMANTFFNIVALFVLLRARSGALHIAQEVLGDGLVLWRPAAGVPTEFALLAVSAALAALLALPLTLFLGKRFARLYDRVPYRKLLSAVIVLLFLLLFLFSGISGLAVALVAICIGLVPPLVGVRRVHLMGAILLPVILYFTGALAGVMAFLGF